MPTMPERMATVETKVASTADDVVEIKTDVKTLLRWYDEERGARRQRQLSMKQVGSVLTAVTIAINVLLKAVG